jgi:hypothetical protein
VDANKYIKRIFFYWATSFVFVSLAYYIIYFMAWLILPSTAVINIFACHEFMPCYYGDYPAGYMAIPCFFYGIIATILATPFAKSKIAGQIFITTAIMVLTVLISLPVACALEIYHFRVRKGYDFGWFEMLQEGFRQVYPEGGWLIILHSFPLYSIICVIACFFITKRGARIGFGKPSTQSA